MRENHITKLLDERHSDLSATERAAIDGHIASCAECRRAYEAAQLSGQLLRQRAAVADTVPPFFQTRVLAAIRERQLTPEPFAFWRMWQAARLLVGGMALAVVLLVGTTFFVNGSAPQVGEGNSVTASADASDQLLLGASPEDVSDSQALAVLYDADDETGGDDGN